MHRASLWHYYMPTKSLGQKTFLKLTFFFPGSLWPHACSTGNSWWYPNSAVKLLLAAVGSGFDSCCVSILGSGMLCCHGQGFLPLCSVYVAVGRRVDPCLGWGDGSEDLLRCHSSLSHVTSANSLLAPSVKHFGFSVWGVLYKSQLLLLFILFIYWSHFSEQGNGKKQAISRFTLFTFHFTFSVWGMLIC